MRVGVILDTDVSKKIKLENKKGIASIVGGIFFLVLMTSGFTVYYTALDSQSQMLNAQQIIADLEVNKIREKFDVVILAAAASDYTVANFNHSKIKSSKKSLVVRLKQVPKMINQIKKIQKNVFLVGY